MKENLDMLFDLNIEDQKDMIRKNWMSHDAKWQMITVTNFGWELGNKLNQDVIRYMGKVMMYRMMNALDISQIENIDEFKSILWTIAQLNYPRPSSIYQFKKISNNILRIDVRKCLTYDNVKKVKAIKEYECGCFALRKGFSEALNITLEQKAVKCLMKGDDCCKILLKIKEWE
ncbi:MAG: hypothetical protein ACFFAH_03560 [Promethearchaeota archaeon]